MMMEVLEIGRVYFTNDGRKVQLVAFTKSDEYVVSTIIEIEDWNGDRNYAIGETLICGKLYPNPPRDVIDAEVERLREEANKLEAKNFQATQEAFNAEQDVLRRLDKLKRYRGLERIEDFIDGKITHVVVKDYSSFQIRPLAEFEDDRSDKGIRLISLYGNSKGDLAWCVNQYKDGSGSSQELRPASSEEDAREVLTAWIKEDIAAQSAAFDPGRAWWFCHAVGAAIKHGIEVSAADMARYNASERKRLLAERERFEKEIATYQERIDALPPIPEESVSGA